MFFGGFLCQSNYDKNKKVQSSGRWLECLGVPSALIVLAGSSIKLWPKKKVQTSGHRLQCRIVLAGLSLCFFAGSFKLQIMTGSRKKVQSSGHQLECLLRTFDSFWMRVVSPASSSLSKSIRKASITATCRLEWHYQLSKKIMAFSLSNIEIQWFFFQVDT